MPYNGGGPRCAIPVEQCIQPAGQRRAQCTHKHTHRHTDTETERQATPDPATVHGCVQYLCRQHRRHTRHDNTPQTDRTAVYWFSETLRLGLFSFSQRFRLFQRLAASSLILLCHWPSGITISGANREFMFLDPNFCPIPNWDLVGISRIFREIIGTRGRQLYHFFLKTWFFMDSLILSFQGCIIVKLRNTNSHNLPGYTISILKIGNNLG